MSFRAESRDAVTRPLDPEMEIVESPRRELGHSRHQSESRQLLPSPRNLFEYSTTSHFRFPESGQSDPRFPDWSFDPQTIRRSRRERWRDLMLDILMMLIGLPFFALAGVVIRVNGRVTGKHELDILEQCIRAAATLFPLIFSVVVGRALVKLASWRLERGAKIGLLEQLMGSRTVGGAISTQFRLHSLTMLAIGLVFLWLLSPLGSQAVLRILSTTTKPIMATSGNVTYVNTRQPSFAGSTSFDSWFSGFAPLFSSTLLASPDVKNGGMDLWSNVKIPYFSSLLNIPPDSDGWTQVPQNNNATQYSSLFGIPVSDLPKGNVSFNLESTYLELNCENITSMSTRDGTEFLNPGLISTNGPFNSAQNVTDTTPWAIGYLGTDVTALLPPEFFDSRKCPDCLPDSVRSMNFFPGIFLYQDFEGAQNVTSIYCTPSQAYVESTVLCNRTETTQRCAVTAQRLSTLPHMPTQITYLSFSQIFTGLSALLPLATQQLNHVDFLQNYIANPDNNLFIQSAQWPSVPSNSTKSQESRFLNIPLQDFGSRLGQVINAFLFGSTLDSPSVLTHSSPLPPSIPAAEDEDLISSIQNLTSTFTVSAKVTSLTEVYVASYPWLIPYLVSALIIPLSALAAAILSRLTKAPDYLGFVSSIARESQYASVPGGGVNMDGMQRARGVRHMRVRLGDVGDAQRGVEIGTGVALNVGTLAIGDEGSTKRIEKRKLYV